MKNILSPKHQPVKAHMRSKSNALIKLGQLNSYGVEFQEVLQKYDIQKKLGQGSFGKVYQAKQKQTGKVVAIKLIEHDYKSEYETLKLIREIEILQFLKD